MTSLNIVITINSVDRTENIVVDSINKQDNINEQIDTLTFNVLKYGGFTYEPEINQEVIMTVGGTRVFGGVIVNIEKTIRDEVAIFSVKCNDFVQFLNRKLVNERYENQTVNAIISDIVSNYTSGFTTTNVDCPITITTVAFDRISVGECFKKLADLVGYSWYVDYNKDIHFFDIGKENAPFNLTDSNGNFLRNTLRINERLDQIRNTVLIRGGEQEGLSRSETYTGFTNQITFPLSNKFKAQPTVTLNGVTVTVGIDFVTAEAAAVCFWDFDQKYLRFKANMQGSTVVAIGIPLFPVIVEVNDEESIDSFGIYEFTKEDKTIKSNEEAIDLGLAELKAYADSINEGGFSTDVSGLRSGQVININSALLGVNEDFVIQRVNFRVLADEKGQWNVTLATLKTMGIISLLQELLRKRELKESETETLLNFFRKSDDFSITDAIGTPTTTSPPYVWSSTGLETNKLFWNLGTWSDA